MQRLLASRTFAAAPRLRAVLEYLLQMLEQGGGTEITEQSIGQAVFSKPPGYNASEDNIVRVTVRHLRNRLEEYYGSEGVNDPVALVVPKGKYLPSFIPHEPLPAALVEEHAGSPPLPEDNISISADESSPAIAVDLASHARNSHWKWTVIAATAVLISFIAGYLFRAAHQPSPYAIGLMGQLFRPGDNVSLVVVDSNLQAYRQIFERQVGLEDYIHLNYAKENLEGSDPRLINAQRFSTGTNETNVSSSILAADIRHSLDGRRLVIKHPHDVSVRDFQAQENVVLLGGPWINPWGQLFESRFNFRLLPLESEPASSKIRNLRPEEGEATEYRPHMDGNLNVNYVRIAIVPNLDNTGHVILLGATSPESLEAAGVYMLSGESIHELLSRFHADSVNHLPPLEFLLEVSGLNAAPESHRILAIRMVH